MSEHESPLMMDELQRVFDTLCSRGVNIEYINQIDTIINGFESKIQDSQKEIDELYSRKKELEEENRTLMQKRLTDSERISHLQDDLRSKDKETDKMMGEKIAQELELQKLRFAVERLETEKSGLLAEKDRMQERQTALENEVKKIHLHGDAEPGSTENHYAKLHSDFKTAREQLGTVTLEKDALETKLAEMRQVHGILEKERDFLQQGFEHMKDERFRLKSKIEELEQGLSQKEEETNRLYQHAHVARRERMEVMEEKDNLLREFHETTKLSNMANMKLTNLNDQLGRLQYENQSLREEVEHIRSTKDDMYEQLKGYMKELEDSRKRIEKLESAREELWKKMMTKDDEIYAYKTRNFTTDESKAKSEEEINRLRDFLKRCQGESRELYSRDDIAVTLKKKHGKFGIKMKSRETSAFIGESRVSVTDIDYQIIDASTLDMQNDDHVICINGVNVQDANMDKVRELTSQKENEMDLILRRPQERERQCEQQFYLEKKSSDKDWGLKLSIVITKIKKGSIAYEQGLLERDEIIKFGKHDVTQLSLNDIRRKLARYKDVDVNIRRTTAKSAQKSLSSQQSLTDSISVLSDDSGSISNSRSSGRNSVDSDHDLWNARSASESRSTRGLGPLQHAGSQGHLMGMPYALSGSNSGSQRSLSVSGKGSTERSRSSVVSESEFESVSEKLTNNIRNEVTEQSGIVTSTGVDIHDLDTGSSADSDQLHQRKGNYPPIDRPVPMPVPEPGLMPRNRAISTSNRELQQNTAFPCYQHSQATENPSPSSKTRTQSADSEVYVEMRKPKDMNQPGSSFRPPIPSPAPNAKDPLHFPNRKLSVQSEIAVRASSPKAMRETRSSSVCTTSSRFGYSYAKFNEIGGRKGDPESSFRVGTTTVLHLVKREYEDFGFQIVGGNQVGIFVHKVENWSSAHRVGLVKDLKILKINEFELEGAAFAYAAEILEVFTRKTELHLTVHRLSDETVQNILTKRPFDTFYVETLVDFEGSKSNEMSFKKGEILRITDSYAEVQKDGTYMWQGSSGKGIYEAFGLVPPQPSIISSRTGISSKRSKDPSNQPILYYKILDDVLGFLDGASSKDS